MYNTKLSLIGANEILTLIYLFMQSKARANCKNLKAIQQTNLICFALVFSAHACRDWYSLNLFSRSGMKSNAFIVTICM